MEKRKQKSQNLRKLFDELEEISSWFQKDDLDLDEAIKKYQRGLELIKEAQTELKEKENTLKKIIV